MTPSEEAALLARITALADWLDSNKPRTYVIPNFWTCRSTDLHAVLELIARRTAERDAARGALARLGSVEAFVAAGIAGPELIARVDYARAELRRQISGEVRNER